jgi:hypothetical protein
MKYSLRSLMIVAIIAPPLLAMGIVAIQRELAKRAKREEINRWLEQYERDMALYGGSANEQSDPHLPSHMREAMLRKLTP